MCASLSSSYNLKMQNQKSQFGISYYSTPNDTSMKYKFQLEWEGHEKITLCKNASQFNNHNKLTTFNLEISFLEERSQIFAEVKLNLSKAVLCIKVLLTLSFQELTLVDTKNQKTKTYQLHRIIFFFSQAAFVFPTFIVVSSVLNWPMTSPQTQDVH